MTKRWFLFFVVIGLGVVVGLAAGRLAAPLKFKDATADTLRVDYQTDYVLMVAEDYRLHPNQELASQRLAWLGSAKPNELISQALHFAVRVGYPAADLALLQALADSFTGQKP